MIAPYGWFSSTTTTVCRGLGTAGMVTLGDPLGTGLDRAVVAEGCTPTPPGADPPLHAVTVSAVNAIAISAGTAPTTAQTGLPATSRPRLWKRMRTIFADGPDCSVRRTQAHHRPVRRSAAGTCGRVGAWVRPSQRSTES